jgi:hypothetical protein
MTEQFLSRIIADDGLFCLWSANGVGKKAKIKQLFFDEIPDLITAGAELDAAGYDVYFGLASFIKAGNRTAANTRSLKSFFVDLDCGPGKAYPSQQSALGDLRRFCREVQLPKPTLVNSGRGIHAYWELDKPIPSEEWLPLGERFKHMCQDRELRIDPAVPADRARVLRIPRTHNHKDNPPAKVVVLGDMAAPIGRTTMEAVLDLYAPEGAAPTKKRVSYADDPLMSALTGNLSSSFKRILERTVKGTGCAQIGHLTKNQQEIDEPLWRAGLSIANACEDRQKAIHIISKNHPNYDPSETEDKAAKTAGPYHCASFESVSPGGCEGCPHRGNITSPIQLGKFVVAATAEDNVVFDKPERVATATLQRYVIPEFPAPYFRGKNGGIYKPSKTAQGDDEDKLIYQHDLYVVSRVVDPEQGDGVVLRLHLPYDGIREFTVPLTSVTSKDEFRKSISKYGVAVANAEELMYYTIKWIDKLAHSNAAEDTKRQFGWINNDLEGFALGRVIVYKDRVETNHPSRSTAALFDMFDPHGTLDEWKRTINFYNRPGFEPHQYVVGCSFGSVLMALTPIRGSIFHFHSKDSGLGKTSAMFAGASIWADPDRYVLKETDTHNAKMLRAEVMKNLPVFMDELSNIKPEDASDLIYQMPSGTQRGRMSRNGNEERWRGDPWSLICVSTANSSIIERVAMYKNFPRAEVQRVVECRATKMHFASKSETDAFSRELKKHYGHAGLIYLPYVIRNIDSVRQLLEKVQLRIDKQARLEAENRHWSAQAAAAVTGIILSNRLGLTSYSIEGLTTWIVEQLKLSKRQDQVFMEDPLEIISDYITDNYSNFLRLHSTDRNTSNESIERLIVPKDIPRWIMVGRHELDLNKWYFLIPPLRKWCIHRHINYQWLVDELKKGKGRARVLKVRMGRGTGVNLPPVSALVVEGKGWMDDIQEQLITAAPETVFSSATTH